MGPECNYTTIKKLCITLVFVMKKPRHYVLAYEVCLIARIDPIKFIMNRLILMGRISKWVVILTEFDIIYVP